MGPFVVAADAALPGRYTAAALGAFDAEERARHLDSSGRPRHPEELPWELLYRVEPDLYAALVAGERLHEGILRWLPAQIGRALEIGAGTGRLTLDLAPRCDSLLAVEPVAGLRDILQRRLDEAAAANVTATGGFFDSLPDAATGFDLVVACSAFTPACLDDPDHCLAVMEGRCVRGGLLVLIWPSDVAWLRARGFEHVVFEGPMLVEYPSAAAAVALARVFYPASVAAVARTGSRFVDFVTLGLNAPRDLCWKRCG
jgi:SAM-dependent methyltransferase